LPNDRPALRVRRSPWTRRTRTAAFAITLAGVSLWSASAFAGDEAAAEALFAEGKRLAAEGKLAEACPKFAESNRLDRGAGTLIHLADCYEKNHQSASAWATFKEAASAAQGLGRADWEKLASARAAALEPKLAKLTIRVTDPADKIEVTRDGTPTSSASWSVPIPVDVGTHVVAASAPGRKPFKASVTVSKDGERDEVVVPPLDVAPIAAVGSPSPAPANGDTQSGSTQSGSTQRTVGYVVGGVGIAGLAAGAITGLIAIGKNNDSKKDCPTSGACASNDAVDSADSAKSFGTVSTIAFIGGAVCTAVGAVLIFTAKSSSEGSGGVASAKEPPRSVRFVPSTDGRSAGMSVMGVF
jgi:hypothetical protein